MPTYEFYNTKTDEMEEHRMSYKDLDKFAEDNPHLEKRISSPNIVSKVGSRNGLGGTGGFNEVLSKVADAHPRSDLAKAVKRRTTKEVKTDEVLKKHAKLQKVQKDKGIKLNYKK